MVLLSGLGDHLICFENKKPIGLTLYIIGHCAPQPVRQEKNIPLLLFQSE